jgi:hypothetical protein
MQKLNQSVTLTPDPCSLNNQAKAVYKIGLLFMPNKFGLVFQYLRKFHRPNYYHFPVIIITQLLSK